MIVSGAQRYFRAQFDNEAEIEKVVKDDAEYLSREAEADIRRRPPKRGVEVEGQVMSLSAAAVYCIQQAGSPRAIANGWTMWRTEDGIYLNDFYSKVYASTTGDTGGLVQQTAPADA